MSRRIRTIPGLFALGILLLLGACSDQMSAEKTLEALSPSLGRSATPGPSPSAADPPAPFPEVEDQPAAGAAPGVGSTVRTPGSRTGSRSSSVAPASGSAGDDDGTPVQAGPPAGAGTNAGAGGSDPTGASGPDGSEARSGDDGDSASGRRDDSRGGRDGDEGDPGSDEDSDEDN